MLSPTDQNKGVTKKPSSLFFNAFKAIFTDAWLLSRLGSPYSVTWDL